MKTNLAQIQQLHRLYCELSGMNIRLDMHREQEWFYWVQAGFTADDLRAVIGHLRRQIRESRRNIGALKFHNLIGQPDMFEEDLAEARALARRPVVNAARAQALRATGRDAAAPSPEPRSAGAVLRDKAAFQEFLKLREKL